MRSMIKPISITEISVLKENKNPEKQRATFIFKDERGMFQRFTLSKRIVIGILHPFFLINTDF